ncbi:MAG: ATP-binding protein [Myxococcota bacterium]|nr:ATP-binding protein [Myxococcota bacterium]
MIVEELRERYLHLFADYLAGEDERHLLDIADLGREFVTLGVPVEEIAELHESTLLLRDDNSSLQGVLSASRPFMELMMSYSLEFRRQSELRLEAERALRKSNDELIKSVHKLEVYQRVFDALPSGISVFRMRDQFDSSSLEFVLGNPAAEKTRVRIEKEEFQNGPMYEKDSAAESRSFSDACVEVIRRGNAVDLGVSVFDDQVDGEVHLHTRAFPLFDRHVGLHVEDVTAQRKLEAQLQRAQQMEVVGRLAGGVAHDFNNVLTTIFGFAEFAAEQVQEQSSVHKDIRQVLHAAERAAALTRQLLSFSRRQGSPRVIDPNSQIRAIDGMVRSLLEEDVDYRVHFSDDVWHIRMDPGALEQVIINLVINARDALPAGGQISLKTENFHVYKTDTSLGETLEPGEYVALTVSDNGTGMSEELQRRVFDPFFTTKDAGKGTGLGLYVCSDLIQQAGGSIHLWSEVGKGARFRVVLPRVKEQADRLRESSKMKKFFGSETILLAEDDDGVRRATCRALRDCGYEVLPAASGEEALRICETHLSRIDLLLTDVVMPSLDGRELAARVRKLCPEIVLLFMSGYTGESLDQRGLETADQNMIQKPFGVETLLQRVRDLLDSKPDW